MKTIKLTGYVHLNPTGDNQYSIWHSDVSKALPGYIFVGSFDTEFPIPEAFNPVAAEVAALEKKLDAMADEYHGKAAQIKDRIANLQCLAAPEIAA